MGFPRPSRTASGLVAAVLAFAFGALVLAPSAGSARAAKVERLVSLNPSLTAIALALGAGDRLVGVDDWSARQDGARHLPRVGGLYSPSLESVVALEPDLVALVPSVEQRDFRDRVASLGIPVAEFRNIRFDEVLENIERLGRLLEREAEAEARIAAIRAQREALARAVAERPAPRTLVVLQREPLFIAGGGNFLDEMVAAAGGENLGRAFDDAYPRVNPEWAIDAAPDVVIDLGPDPAGAEAFWRRWPSLPAVAAGRVLTLPADRVSLPGPHLDESLRLLAEALHGSDVLAEGPGPATAGAHGDAVASEGERGDARR